MLSEKQNLPPVLTVPEGNRELALFGYRIPYLPDFLSDHTLLGQSPSEKLGEVLQRFERFVIGLHKYRESAYALRFVSQPEDGAVSIYLLGRIISEPGRAAHRAGQLATDLRIHLTTFGLPYEAMTGRLLGNKRLSLERILHPFADPCTIVEIRQHEQLVPLITVRKEAYVIHPYWEPDGTCLEPFETLLQQPEPVAVSIYLEPTEITSAEYESLSEAAHIAQTLADLDVKTYSDTGVRRRRDPGAELVGRIYSAYLNALMEPFILVVQVASADPNAAWTVARSYASAITRSQGKTFPGATEHTLPSATDIVAPADHAETAIVSRAFESLLWKPWGNSLASPGKEAEGILKKTRGVRRYHEDRDRIEKKSRFHSLH